MSELLNNQLEQYILERKHQGLYRSRCLPSSTQTFLDFSSNDYLSLTNDIEIKLAYQTGFADYPVGAGGSMVLCGYHPTHRQLEQDFAKALLVDDCLLFSSGYVANLAVVGLLSQFGARLLIDKAVHASVYDGLTLAGSNFSRFSHNNMDDLLLKLKDSNEPTIVLTESVFSMSGQQAPLVEMVTLLQQANGHLVVDEAHGFGVLGEEGLGGVSAAGLSQTDVPLRVIPFGKALGASGAIVAGNAMWIDALLQSTRQPVYSTAISPAYAHGVRVTLAKLRASQERSAHLTALIDYFRKNIQKSSLLWRDSTSPIQQLQLGCPYKATTLANKLAESGIRCFAIRHPTVPKQESGLRVILNFHHSYEDIDTFFKALSQ